ncbi:MAG: hypothetical protein IKN53_00840, partial [Oscillibacter sp.]|nr:hypothetical protein [Oscillibacter sp.]
MERIAERKLKRYLAPCRGVRLAAWALLLAALASLAVGALRRASARDEEAAAPAYDAQTPVGTVACMDAVGMSDWIYESGYERYYVLADAETFL